MGMKDSILKLNIQQRWGSVEKGGDRRSHKQVAMAKLDLNKTQSVCGGYGGI
jgi:hypothetical protein